MMKLALILFAEDY